MLSQPAGHNQPLGRPRDMRSFTVAWPRAVVALRLARCSTVSLSRTCVLAGSTHVPSVVRDTTCSINQRRCFSASSPARTDASSGQQGPPLVTSVESAGSGLSKVQWDDGHSAVFVNAWLRDHCRCADCLHQVCCVVAPFESTALSVAQLGDSCHGQ